MVYASVLFLFCLVNGGTAFAQTSPNAPTDSVRIIALPDVSITGSSQRLIVASGTEDNKHAHILGPGGGNAVRFLAAQAGFHHLRQVRLHLRQAGSLPANNLHVRVASVTEAGNPADDNLLPAAALLLPTDLRRAQIPSRYNGLRMRYPFQSEAFLLWWKDLAKRQTST